MKEEEVLITKVSPDQGKALELSINGEVIQYVFVPIYRYPNFIFGIKEVEISEVPEDEVNKYLDFKNILQNNKK